MEKNLQRLAVSCQDDELRLASVEGLGGLVGSLPQLLVVGGLLDKIENLGSQSLVSQGIGLGVHFFRHLVGANMILSALLTSDWFTASRPHGGSENLQYQLLELI